MKNFKQHINDLKQETWDYYYDFSVNKLDNPFFDKISHTEFIKKYFKRSGKDIALDLITVNDVNITKANHTNSIFFLGILLYNNTKTKKLYFKKFNPAGYQEFPFIWFLTCLFHDFGVEFEENKEKLMRISDIDTLKKELKIDYCLLDKRVNGINKILFNNIRHYFIYRRFYHKKIDHGIVAGLYFYDKLVKNRIEKEKKRTNDLFWGKKLEEQYALASSAIATHNIWIPNNETAYDFFKFEMKSLINFKPVSLNSFPLLYILGIVDTIDPIKAFCQKHSEDYIFENLLVEFSNNEMIIKNRQDSKLDFKIMLGKSDNFEDWLDVEVKKEKDKLTLRLK